MIYKHLVKMSIKNKKSREKIWSTFDEENINYINEYKNINMNDDKNINDNLCNKCKSNIYTSIYGLLACSNKECGILIKDIIDQSAEWRYYGADDNKQDDTSRCGMPVNPLLIESSMGCKVLCNNKSSYEMRKISRYTNWLSMPYKEKTQYDEFQKISIIANQSNIPKIIIDKAIIFYKKFSEAKTFRGLNRDGIIAASIYISFRENKYPRTIKEISSIFHIDNTSTTRGCKIATSLLNVIEDELPNEDKTNLFSTSPSSFIYRYCSRLNINNEYTKLCMFVAETIEKKNLIPENTPHSIAAGVIYFVSSVCKLNLSRKAVYIISEVSEVTINKCFKKLESIKDKLIPPSLIKH